MLLTGAEWELGESGRTFTVSPQHGFAGLDRHPAAGRLLLRINRCGSASPRLLAGRTDIPAEVIAHAADERAGGPAPRRP